MSPSPVSMPPSSPIADDTTDDNALQPFFVLHKALPQKCDRKAAGSTRTRRKIDLPPSSPKSPEKSDAVASSVGPNDANYERLRLEAFDMTWSKIDTTIKEVLTRVHRNLFAEVHQWALKSFLALKSGKPRNAFEIQTPYPLLNDVICKQIPTAMILTKNAEFVDDMLTFQELGEHLKSKGCHIANLSAMDFCAKDGIAGCLRSLLRQLVMDAPDMADMSVLSSWYCEPENYDHPVIIVIDDMERCSGVILADFIRLLSEWVIKLPVIFIMGVATTDTAKKLLPSDALQHLQSSKFTLGSPLERMNAIVEAVLVKPSFGFNIGHNVAVFMRNYFLGHDGTITSFVRALKLACVKHFSMEPLSFLGIDILDENQVFLHGKCDALPDSLLKYAFNLPSCKRGKDCKNSRDDLGEGLSDLRKLLKAWSSVILCLYEVGKHNKIQLLDIFCEATDPTLSSLDPSNHKLERSFNGQNLADGRLDFKGGLIGQLIHTVRELPLSSLIKLLDSWSIHTEELCEVHGEVRELQSVVKSSNGGNNLKERQIDCHRMSMSLCAGRTSLSVNGKAAALLDNMVRKFLMPIECLCFHEIICFRNVDILQSALIGNPRRNIQVDLMKSTTYIKCNCCSSNGNVLSPTMHDTSVMYNLAQEHGDLINLQDWYHSFKSTVLSTNKLKCPLQHSPMSKKVKSSPSEKQDSAELLSNSKLQAYSGCLAKKDQILCRELHLIRLFRARPLRSWPPMAVSAAVVSSPFLGSRSLITLTRSKRFLRLASAGTPLVPIGASRRCMVRRAGNSSYSPVTAGSRGGSGFSDRPPTEMPPLFPGCDYEHWLIVMDKPGGEGATKQQMIDCYIQTLAKVVGSEEEAKRRIYNVSCERYFGFGCEIDEETSNKLEGLPGVLFVLPDSYVDAENKDYGAELFVNGEIVQRSPERQRRVEPVPQRAQDRPRYNDRTRYVRRRENRQ
ncbi:unnamed protein product [Musa hybrid cultivar]